MKPEQIASALVDMAGGIESLRNAYSAYQFTHDQDGSVRFLVPKSNSSNLVVSITPDEEGQVHLKITKVNPRQFSVQTMGDKLVGLDELRQTVEDFLETLL